MSSRPNRSTVRRTAPRTSSSRPTSALLKSACPLLGGISEATSSPGGAGTSTAAIRAPSRAKVSAASRPMPLAPPVISATLSRSLMAPPPTCSTLDALEVAAQFPAGDRPVERLLLEPGGVQVVLDDAVAERLAGDFAPLQLLDRLAQRPGDPRDPLRFVGVPLEHRGGVELPRDAPPPAGGRRRKPQAGIGVCARDPVLDPQALAFAHHAKPAGPVVVAPDRHHRRERSGHVAFVRVDVRGEEIRQLAGARQLPREVVPEHGGHPERPGPFFPEEVAPAVAV